MRRTTQSRKTTRKSKKLKERLPVSVVTREGKTTVRQFEGRRFIRLGEVRGKTVAWVEIYTGGPNGHSVTVRFQDQTGLHLDITPGFAIQSEYFNMKTGDYRLLKKWPEIKSER
jgi:hypothetical protein